MWSVAINGYYTVRAHDSAACAPYALFGVNTFCHFVSLCVGTLGDGYNLFGTSVDAQATAFAVSFAELNLSFCHKKSSHVFCANLATNEMINQKVDNVNQFLKIHNMNFIFNKILFVTRYLYIIIIIICSIIYLCRCKFYIAYGAAKCFSRLLLSLKIEIYFS